MFTIEQHIEQNSENSQKRGSLRGGTTLARQQGVKRGITYKEVILAFGIMIALLVAMTLWGEKPEQPAPDADSTSLIFESVAKKGRAFLQIVIQSAYHITP